MPELPEVQTVLDALTPLVIGHRIIDVTALWERVIDRPSLPTFRQGLIHRAVVEGQRRGKYLLFRLDNDRWLVMHLRMTGELYMATEATPLDRHDRLILHLTDGSQWRFKDQRKFGRVYLIDHPHEIVGKLGPEPLSDALSAEYLAARLAQRAAPIKSLLLDQTLIAGLGNIYVDESLFRARLHPLRRGGSLTVSELDALVEAIRAVIHQALAEMGTTLRNYRRPDGSIGEFQNSLHVFRRTGKPCPLCGTPIQRIVVGGRSTHFCPYDQH